MRNWLLCLLFLCFLVIPVSAEELIAPEAPDEVQSLLPKDQDSFGEGIWYIIRSAICMIGPDISKFGGICLSVIGASMLISMLQSYDGKSKSIVHLCGAICVAGIMLSPANNLVSLATDTIRQLSDYGKLLLPVMTAALASQGGVSSSAALYVATVGFDAVITGCILHLMIPGIYLFLSISLVLCCLEDAMVQKLRDLIRWGMTWGLKISLYAIFGYLSITGVVTGTADQTAVKAAKLTISGMVPVIGNLLSDASETVIVSAGIVKNAVGIYGILALIAIVAVPFLKIGLQYILLKFTGTICEMFSCKSIQRIMDSFTVAMGFLLAMTGTVCLILLISIVCFMKGMG